MLRFSKVIAVQKSFAKSQSITRCLASSSVVRQAAEAATKPAPTSDDGKRQNMSFMANLFSGNLQTSQVFPYPDVLSQEDKEYVGAFVDPVTKFFTEVNDSAKNDENGTCDEPTLKALWELGGFGMQVPPEYGGLGTNNTQYSRMAEIVGEYDLGVGIVIGAHQSIGFKGILLYGTKEQKEKYLPQVSAGKVYAAFALTEPSSGSDAGSIRCRAVKSADGKHYILNGSKIWISNGGVANIMTVFAQTEVTDPKTGEKKDKVTAFIVEREFGGVTNGAPEKKMGIKASNTAEVFFEDVKIPIENVLGGEGNGFKVAMNILNNGRFGMAGTLGGTMAACIRKAAEHASNRLQFGKKIEEYGSIQEKLARMGMLQYVAQSMAYMISQNMDSGSQDFHLEAAISKVFASEAAWHVCDEAIQILGGMGYMKETGLEKVLRDLRIFRIFEGTNDILRLFVALTGIQFAGSHLKELQKAFKNPAANLGLIFSESTKRIYRTIGFGGTDLSSQVDTSLVDSAKLCAQSIDSFAASVESLLMKHGKGIIDKQFMLNQLANSAIDIYAMAVVLSRATQSIQRKYESADYERLLAKSWCTEASERVQINLNKLSNDSYKQLWTDMETISRSICKNQGVVSTNPLRV